MPLDGGLSNGYIERLLQIILPNGGYSMAIVEAYFDESGTHDGSPFLCVAGYIFEKEKAAQLEVEWRKMLAKYKLPYFHMSECAQNKGVYSHLSRDECDAVARAAIGLTKTYAAKGIAISIEPGCFELLPPNQLWDDPYAFLSCQVFYGAEKWADAADFHGEIAYFFEAGADAQSKASNAMVKIASAPIPKKRFRWGSHTFLDKSNAAALQCADLLAWHWFTHNKRIQRGEKRARRDFKSLAELRNIDMHHYDKTAIEKWLVWMSEAGQ